METDNCKAGNCGTCFGGRYARIVPRWIGRTFVATRFEECGCLCHTLKALQDAIGIKG